MTIDFYCMDKLTVRYYSKYYFEFHRQKENQTVLEQHEAKYTDKIIRFWVHLGDI